MEGGLQELEETLYWLELLAHAKIISIQKTQPLLREADELIAIFVTMVKKVKAKP